jgi:hypothetical protein
VTAALPTRGPAARMYSTSIRISCLGMRLTTRLQRDGPLCGRPRRASLVGPSAARETHVPVATFRRRPKTRPHRLNGLPHQSVPTSQGGGRSWRRRTSRSLVSILSWSLGPTLPLQGAAHGLQCGFCTPGSLISITALLERNPTPTNGGFVRASCATCAAARLPEHRARGEAGGRTRAFGRAWRGSRDLVANGEPRARLARSCVA